MIADLLPTYYEQYETNLRFETLRSVVVDGHEVAWMQYTGTYVYDLLGNDREGKQFSGHILMCECNFTEGIGWNIGENGTRYTVGPSPQTLCLPRKAAMYLRHLELRREYTEKFATDTPIGLMPHVEEIILDMIEKAKAGEWIEDGNGAASWGGYFYLNTVAAIIDQTLPQLFEQVRPLLERNVFSLDGHVVKTYTPPPPAAWEEYMKIEADGWTGIALLPTHSRMEQTWKFELVDLQGKTYHPDTTLELIYEPVFGPDQGDVLSAQKTLQALIDKYSQEGIAPH